MATYLLGGAVALGVVGVGFLGLAKVLTPRIARCSPRSDFSYKKLSESEVKENLSGKKAFVVGGTKGIGAALALGLAASGADVVIAGRSDSEGVVAQMKTVSPKGSFSFIKADLSTVAACCQCAKDYTDHHDMLDLLVFTVGIMPDATRKEVEGLEIDFMVSYFSRYVILNQMTEYLKTQAKRGAVPKVFVVAAPGGTHNNMIDLADPQTERNYGVLKAHNVTIIMNEVLVLDYAKSEPEIPVFGLSPGLIVTDIRQPSFGAGIFGNLLEKLIAFAGNTMEDYVRDTLVLFASSQIGKSTTGALFNFLGEAIHPNPNISKSDLEKMAAYARELYQSKLKKNQ